MHEIDENAGGRMIGGTDEVPRGSQGTHGGELTEFEIDADSSTRVVTEVAKLRYRVLDDFVHTNDQHVAGAERKPGCVLEQR